MSGKKAYVIGNNVRKSLSPAIFKYWFKKYNIDGEYGYIEIKEKNFNKKIKSILKEEKLCGLNITIPYKEKIIPHLTKIDKHSNKIRAVNCVIKKNNSLYGVNTDWSGFFNIIKNFERKNSRATKKGAKEHPLKYNTAIVIGYGGAGKAIVYSLIQMGFKTIKVFNRTFEKIRNINDEACQWSSSTRSKIIPLKIDDLLSHTLLAEIIINTTPNPNIFKELVLSKGRFVEKGVLDRHNIGVDINYDPSRYGIETFLQYFVSTHRIHGIDMLMAQAAPCFKRWFGVSPNPHNSELRSKLIDILKNK